MIVYDPLWTTMKRRGIKIYTLIKVYSFSRGTLDSLKQKQNISTATLNELCRILSCKVDDILEYIPDESSKARSDTMILCPNAPFSIFEQINGQRKTTALIGCPCIVASHRLSTPDSSDFSTVHHSPW